MRILASALHFGPNGGRTLLNKNSSNIYVNNLRGFKGTAGPLRGGAVTASSAAGEAAPIQAAVYSSKEFPSGFYYLSPYMLQHALEVYC